MSNDAMTQNVTHDLVTKPRMQPVTFDGCFGWIHDRHGGVARHCAVLICTGLTHDKLTGHRPYRLLADALEAEGYPVLRFDYPDTGNSADISGGDHWSLWQQSIATAIDWLRARTGATRVVLVGLRIGAALAALVAERRDDVGALVMLEPVLRGRPYLRQLAIEQMLNGGHNSTAAKGLDSHGLRLSREAVRNIEAVDLRQVRPPPNCRVAVYSQASSPVLSAFLDAWRDAADGITAEGFDGLEPFLRATYRNHEASADTTHIVKWILQAVPQTVQGAPLMPAPRYVPLRAECWVEMPLSFGPHQHLFGMLCRPPDHAGTENAATGMVVLILSTGGNPHYGHSGLSSELARRLAADGITSLRMDFAGIGDATDGGEDVASHILETDREADISAALDALEALGYRRFALQGLCTGAFHALYGALADRRVGAVLLLNLPMFTWRKGDPLDTIGVRKPSHYLRRLGGREVWVLLRQRQLTFVRPALAMRGALTTWWRTVTERLAVRQARSTQPSFGQRCLTILAARQVRTLFLYSADDGGLETLKQEFAPGGFPPPHVADLQIVAGLDHVLSRISMRQIATGKMADFLKQIPGS